MKISSNQRSEIRLSLLLSSNVDVSRYRSECMMRKSVLKEAVYHETTMCTTAAKETKESVVKARLNLSTVESKVIYPRLLNLLTIRVE